MMNIVNGGQHADNAVDVQEFMVMPLGFDRSAKRLRAGVEMFHTLKKVLKSKKLNTAVGDEGGFAPDLPSNAEALDLIMRSRSTRPATSRASRSGIALDVAATELYDAKKRTYNVDGKEIDSAGMVDFLAGWVDKYPICSIEDGCSEDDWEGWKMLTQAAGRARCNWSATTCSSPTPSGCSAASTKDIANSILIKVNQIGTLTETIEAIQLAQSQRLHQRSPAIAAARPRTRRSPTWPWPCRPARSRPAAPRAPTAWPSTINCCGSRKAGRHGRNTAAGSFRSASSRREHGVNCERL